MTHGHHKHLPVFLRAVWSQAEGCYTACLLDPVQKTVEAPIGSSFLPAFCSQMQASCVVAMLVCAHSEWDEGA